MRYQRQEPVRGDAVEGVVGRHGEEEREQELRAMGTREWTAVAGLIYRHM